MVRVATFIVQAFLDKRSWKCIVCVCVCSKWFCAVKVQVVYIPDVSCLHYGCNFVFTESREKCIVSFCGMLFVFFWMQLLLDGGP